MSQKATLKIRVNVLYINLRVNAQFEITPKHFLKINFHSLSFSRIWKKWSIREFSVQFFNIR